MNRRTYLLTGLGLTLAALITTPELAAKKKKNRVDGVTTASTRVDPLPALRDDAYTLLGTVSGLKSPLIKYDANLYSGGWIYSDAGYKKLSKMGIKTIISFLPSKEERAAADTYGFHLVDIEIDERKPIPEEQLQAFSDAVKQCEKPIFMHCYSGLPISGTFGARYRIDELNWTTKRALNEYTRLGGDLTLDQKILEGAGILVK